MTPLLEVKDLSVLVKIESESRSVLRNVSLTVEAGEAVALVGESGAGKSMLARTVTRMLPAGALLQGQALFEGNDIHGLKGQALQDYRQAGVSLIPQDPYAAMNPVHTVGDFLTEPLVVTGRMPAGEARHRAAEALQEVAIDEPSRVLDRYPHELSGGMLQRVMICAAVLSDSRLIVADEPTTALDATTQSDVMAILNDLRCDRHLALLFITHDLELAAAVCDRIAVIYAGEIVEIQDARSLEASPQHPYTDALFAARPRIDSPDHRLAAIPGRPAAAYEADPDGCAYASRCSWVRPECEAARPMLRRVGHASVRCIRAEELDVARRPRAATDSPPRQTATIPRASGTGAGPILSISELRKVFASRGPRTHWLVAVEGVTFDLPAGGSIAVVGESGSGKSTLVRMVAGLESPTSGLISFMGEERTKSRRAAERRRFARCVQMVFQDPNNSLDPRQSGHRCLDEMLRVQTDLRSAERDRRIAELGEQVGLGQRELDRLPRELSGGQRQRLAIARALAIKPEVVILDEAVSALDVSVQAQILNLLRDIRQQTGVAYIFVSHNLAVVRQISETVLVMQRGKVVETGNTGDVLDHPQHPYTQLLRSSVPSRGWEPVRRGLSSTIAGPAAQAS